MFSDIYAHLLICAVVRLPHPRSGDIQGQETFLAPSAGKQTRNCDKDSSSHDLSIAIRHWDWAVTGQNSEPYIYVNLLINAIVRLTHSSSGDIQGQETFLAHSADKQIDNYDRKCSKYYLSYPHEALRLSRGRIKWCP